MYGKIFASLWDGTLATDWPAWSVLVYMIANCDRTGRLDATHEAISMRAGIPLDIVRDAVDRLSAPDPKSRSDKQDGRRIEPIDPRREWGWKIINYGKYRSLITAETRREQARERKREERRRKVTARHTMSHDVTAGHKMSQDVTGCHARPNSEDSEAQRQEQLASSNMSRDVTLRHAMSRQAEAEADLKQQQPSSPDGDGQGRSASPKKKKQPPSYSEDFLAWWSDFPRKVGKGAAWRAWKAAGLEEEDAPIEAVARATRKQKDQWKKEGRAMDKIPHPATWINQLRWEDETP